MAIETRNVVPPTQELNFYLILINFQLNSHTQLVTFILDGL